MELQPFHVVGEGEVFAIMRKQFDGVVVGKERSGNCISKFRIIPANWSKYCISSLSWHVRRVSCLLGAIAVLREWGTEFSQQLGAFCAGLVMTIC